MNKIFRYSIIGIIFLTLGGIVYYNIKMFKNNLKQMEIKSLTANPAITPQLMFKNLKHYYAKLDSKDIIHKIELNKKDKIIKIKNILILPKQNIDNFQSPILLQKNIIDKTHKIHYKSRLYKEFFKQGWRLQYVFWVSNGKKEKKLFSYFIK